MNQETRDALLRAIRAEPAEDTSRLVYADFLEENGDPKRAQFIRKSIADGHKAELRQSQAKEWFRPWWLKTPEDPVHVLTVKSKLVIRPASRKSVQGDWGYPEIVVEKGFCAGISITCRDFTGFPCRTCTGWQPPAARRRNCPACKESLVAPNAALHLFEGPVEVVRLRDRTPARRDQLSAGRSYAWTNAGYGSYAVNRMREQGVCLPPELFDLLPKMNAVHDGKLFPSGKEAVEALSRAAVELGRKQYEKARKTPEEEAKAR